jgi:two-component system chemotaxis response regulator CheB
MDEILRVLVVDDSAYVRKVVKEMLSRSPFIEVVGMARDGVEALEMVEELQPDVVTTDLIMPNLDGVEFVREQMARRPLPVIVVSIASESGEMALTALDAGAIDFVQKPTALANEKIFEISDELIQKVNAAAHAGLRGYIPRLSLSPLEKNGNGNTKGDHPANAAKTRDSGIELVVIGISTGGPQALKQMIPQFPADFPVPVVIVLHLPVGYTEMYAKKLDEISSLKVVEVRQGDVLRRGVVWIAPAGRHLSFNRNQDGEITAHLDARPLDTPHRPSVDVLFESAAAVFKNRVLGVVMTGMGSDGKQGAAWIKSQGGQIFTEAEETCVVYGMPAAVVQAGLSDKSVRLDDMSREIMEVM